MNQLQSTYLVITYLPDVQYLYPHMVLSCLSIISNVVLETMLYWFLVLYLF